MRDSPFAYFDETAPGPINQARGKILNLSPRALVVLELLRASGAALTTSMLAWYLGCKKQAMQRNMYSLQRAGLAYLLDCFRDGHSVRVWLASTIPVPSTRESARLAALGLLYLRLRSEHEKLGWETLPGALARMVINKEHLVEPVRRGEKPNGKATLLVHPTMEEARQNTPGGKLYTADTVLLSGDADIMFR
ncbi:MAG: hypothetical protein FH756_17445 [Firmicutes bacterium]|nr:hypothetical protein [Bacillota bacterium]